MKRKTRLITEISVAISLSVILSFIAIYKMPQGGSVSLTMVPIIIISYRRGFWPGICCGALYGFISLLFDGGFYHPLSVLLDYILAFGILGVCGIFKKNLRGIVLGTCTGVGGRFALSLISGAVIFADYAPYGQNPWVYSFIYQMTYMLPELIICLFTLVVIYLKAKVLFFPSK